MIDIQQCPLCESPKLQKKYIQSGDYFLSRERFSISKCVNCSFLFTDPRPEDEKLHQYYESEEYLSHDSNISSVKAWLYQAVKKHALKTKYQLVVKHSGLNTGKILDFGCGNGRLLKYFAQNGWNVAGVEPSDKARNFAVESLHLPVFPTIEKIPADEKYDVIMLWHVIEHLPQLHESIAQLKSKLARDGSLFIAIPNIKSPDAAHYGRYWAALDLPRHLYHFNRETFEKFAQQKALSIRAILPMKFDSFYVSLLSEKYKANSLQFVRAFYQGLRSNMLARKTNNYSSLIFVLKENKP